MALPNKNQFPENFVSYVMIKKRMVLCSDGQNCFHNCPKILSMSCSSPNERACLSGWHRKRTGTGPAKTAFPGTESRTGTVGTVFQEPKPEPEPCHPLELYSNAQEAFRQPKRHSRSKFATAIVKHYDGHSQNTSFKGI